MSDDKLDALLQMLDKTACMLRGMTLDPTIPEHAKQAMRTRIAELESMVEENMP